MEIIIGVDLHKKTSSFAVLDRTERVLEEATFENMERSKILEFIRKWKTRESTLTLIVEATGFWYWFVQFVRPLVDTVKLADPFWAKRRLEGRPAKNDKIDARDLAKLYLRRLLVEGYVMAPEIRDLRDLLRTRMCLVENRSSIKNRVWAALAQHGLNGPATSLFSEAGKEWIRARAELSSIWIQQLLVQIDAIRGLDRQVQDIESIAERCELLRTHPCVRLLQSIPGVGPIWAMTLALEIGDIRRFPSADALVCYAGLAPTVNESGGHRHYTGLHSHRNNWIKGALGMVALHAKKSPRLNPEYVRARRRYKAIVANLVVARKLARIIHCMLTRKELFRESDPKAALSA